MTEPRGRLDRAFGVDGPAEDGKVHFLQSGHIPAAAVDHQAGNAACLKGGREQVAEEAVLAFGGAGGHHHVAGLDLLGGDVPAKRGFQYCRWASA